MSNAKTKPTPATPKPSAAREHVAVRLSPAELARVDAEGTALRASLAPGIEITRSDVLRNLLLRGLDAPPALAVKV